MLTHPRRDIPTLSLRASFVRLAKQSLYRVGFFTCNRGKTGDLLSVRNGREGWFPWGVSGIPRKIV